MSQITLTAGQAEAVETVRTLRRRQSGTCAVLAGYAGTGKTTCVKQIVEELGDALILAPTGRAALRVREATGLGARTIHSWLYAPVMRGGRVVRYERRTAEKLLEVRPASGILVVDEASMVGREIYADLIDAAEEVDLRILFVGDGFQLPPVAAKGAKPFSIFDPACLGVRLFKRVDLTEVMRQALDSPIVRSATAVRNGAWANHREMLADLPKVRERVSDRATSMHALHALAGAVKIDHACIAHRNVTRQRLNIAIREKLGCIPDQLSSGEPLLVRKNDYTLGVFNGEITPFERWLGSAVPNKYGIMLRPMELVRGEYGETKIMAVLCEDFVFDRAEVQPEWAKQGTKTPYLHAQLGYALTCHSAQGSEWSSVLVVVEPSLKALTEEERMRWLYTSITRAKVSCEIAYLQK